MYKRKIIIASIALLLILVLLTTSTYAWLTLSRTPEVSGVETHIGANGSLEIALLSDTTYVDPSLIGTLVGTSSSIMSPLHSNLYWGNVIFLDDEGYGLSHISLLPSRLNIHPGENGKNVINTNMLIIPEYNIEGRFQKFVSDTVSATYQQNGQSFDFLFTSDRQNYGVRGIGKSSKLTPQQSSLANSRSLVDSYIKASKSSVESIWKANGVKLIDLYFDHYLFDKDSFSDNDVALIRDTATRLNSTVSYVDLALRQGIIGYSATVISDVETFKTVRNTIENTAIPLSHIINVVAVDLPDSIVGLVSKMQENKSELQKIVLACDKLNGGSYTWQQILPIIEALFSGDKSYLGQNRIDKLNSSHSMGTDNVVTIYSGAGIMADIADYSGDYSIFLDYSDQKLVEVKSLSNVSPSRLEMISDVLAERKAATDDGTVFSTPLREIYGYMIDVAFRCNADTELLLQTSAVDRVESGEESLDTSAETFGSGSYMKFSSELLDTDRMIAMMDAIRIGFMDNRNNLLCIAKLGTSNYVEKEDGIYAPVYLYDYAVSVDGSISIGGRQDDKSIITTLPKNTPVVVTAVVWLDGDHVDNSLSGIAPQSMTGMLNLQFSSSVNLKPAEIPLG